MSPGNYKEKSIDVFGDAYAQIMSLYISNAGKSDGDLFTLPEVSGFVSRVAVVVIQR
ncbi:MAG: N-6 DNA methylase [Anaerolineaceae bacterium]|jgi:type I restriction enzyme M protein